MAMDGAETILADYSEHALKQSRLAFRRKARSAAFLQEDIRSLSLEDKQVDLCWNAGVLEHYERNDRLKIISEMARVTRKEGSVIVFAPNARCLPYRLGKAYAEKTGAWDYGLEMPLHSLKEEFQLVGLSDVKEFDIAFDTAFDFLDFLPEQQTLKAVFKDWYEELPEQERGLVPGYLIVTAGTVV